MSIRRERIFVAGSEVEAVRNPARSTNYMYDAIVVLGGRIQRQEDIFVPADHTQSDEHGMTGGDFRIDGAVGAYFRGYTRRFVFSGGRRPPINDKTTPLREVPTEADVYQEAFTTRFLKAVNKSDDMLLEFLDMELPLFYKDRVPVDTFSGIENAREIAIANEWQTVGLMTNLFHTDRVAEDVRSIPRETGVPQVGLDVIPAEWFAQDVFGVDQRIKHWRAHFSRPGIHAYNARRIAEINGIRAKRSGTYRSREK
jgi:hypothetical protein